MWLENMKKFRFMKKIFYFQNAWLKMSMKKKVK